MLNVSRTGRQLLVPDSAPFPSCHASSIAALPDGRLLCVWFGGAYEGAEDVAIWGALCENGVWSAPRKIAAQAGLPHWNPVLFVRDDGAVLLFYKVGKCIPSWSTRLTVSTDCGQTWSAPRELVTGDVGGRGPVRNHLLVLPSGRWLAPASLEEGEWRCFADISDDRGSTWHKSAEIRVGFPDTMSEQERRARGVIQPALWESGAGQVHMLMRSSEGCLYRSDSQDEGTTWCPAYATDLPNNNSGICLTRVPDGNLYLVYNPVGADRGPRTPLTLACSQDNGESWRNVFTLEDAPGEYSYPDICWDGHELLVTYTYQRKNIAFWAFQNQ